MMCKAITNVDRQRVHDVFNIMLDTRRSSDTQYGRLPVHDPLRDDEVVQVIAVQMGDPAALQRGRI